MQERTIDGAPRLTDAEMHSYWGQVSARHLDADAESLATVCFAGMPAWFNRFMHRYQMKAFRRLLAGQSFAGSHVLDVGTGTGRWARWFAAAGADVTGIDIEPARLARAASLSPTPRDGVVPAVRYLEMGADALSFPADAFDAVNSVTVLQHIPEATRRRAIAEIARVLRPGGRAIIFEVTDLADDAPHVFPWPQAEWRRAFEAQGLVLQRTVGEQYIPLLRLMKRAHRSARRGGARAEIDALKGGRGSVADRLTMLALRIAIAASYPLEEACRFLPSRNARIAGFLFVKRGPSRAAAA